MGEGVERRDKFRIYSFDPMIQFGFVGKLWNFLTVR